MIPKLFISPDLETRLGEIEKNLTGLKIKNPHPDLLYFSSEAKLGIEQSRSIKEHLSYKPTQAKGKIVILEDASNLTGEAQNALLKILEEAPPLSLIILGVKSAADLFPTIISRCQISYLKDIVGARGAIASESEEIENLLQADIRARFEYVEKLKDKEGFLHALISYFRQELHGHSVFLEELLQAEEWAAQNVNIRAILEYLMLVMPKKS